MLNLLNTLFSGFVQPVMAQSTVTTPTGRVAGLSDTNTNIIISVAVAAAILVTLAVIFYTRKYRSQKAK